jgi:transposase InsO family protein
VLPKNGVTASMSRRGNCWDNACSETLACVSPERFEQDGLAAQAKQVNS